MINHTTRREFIAGSARLVAAGATLSVLGVQPAFGMGASAARAQAATSNADRAVALYNAMQNYFYLSDSKLYLETYPKKNGNPYAYLWPFYEAMAGTIDMLGVPSIGANYSDAVTARLAALKYYYHSWNGPTASAPITYNRSGYDSYPRGPYGSGGDRYDDDNAWVGRALLQLQRMMNTRMTSTTYLMADGVTSLLDGAIDVYQFLLQGYDTNMLDPYPGGEFWVQASWNRDRGTAATGGLAKVALHLCQLSTPVGSYLTQAKNAYNWARSLPRPSLSANLYSDKVRGDGTIDSTVWSYNQGVMIGAGALLARISASAGDNLSSTTYLNQAIATANATLTYFKGNWYSQPVIFNVLFFRNLLLLYDATKDSSYLNAVQSFADQVWNDNTIHNMQTNLIKFDPSTGAYKLREQAAMVQIYACLAWSSVDYSKLG